MIVQTGESQQTPTSGRYQEDLALVIVKLGVPSRRSQGKGPTYPLSLSLSLSPNLHSASNFYLNLVLCSLLFPIGVF